MNLSIFFGKLVLKGSLATVSPRNFKTGQWPGWLKTNIEKVQVKAIEIINGFFIFNING